MRPEVILVTSKASEEKVAGIKERLEFGFGHLGKPLRLHSVPKATLPAIFMSAGLATADENSLVKFARRALPWVADLDYESNPYDGWEFADLITQLSGDAWRDHVENAHATLVGHIRRLQADDGRAAYLFGTGPSLQLARKRAFDDGTVIACNTIVRDPDLWNHLKPSFLVAGDAIYHFGSTPHSLAFRADALRRIDESEGRTLFVYPAMFDAIVRPEFKAVEQSLIPIPIGLHTDITVDLSKNFSLPKVGNVLNHLLLPVGCTVSKDLRLWGFDGRGPQDVGFWSNSDRHSYPELMQGIRDAHPAFFADFIPKGNENQYVSTVHGDFLDERLTEAEGRGFRFEMLHKSWTPTLQKRYVGSFSTG
ncbi:MAG: hypothetical protein PGN37_01625 [Mycobacterium kyogaense]|uniref:hypothetical protein n=1 Tax=Mycobacterium kyogaense TaxID=2212479 RepID=UPI002FF6C2CA